MPTVGWPEITRGVLDVRRQGLAVGRDGVQAMVEVHGVHPGPARDGRHVGGLVPRAHGVVAGAAIDGVGAQPAADLVVAGPAAHDVGAAVAVDGVGAVAAIEHVGLVAAVDLVVAVAGVDRHGQVQSVVGAQRVGAGTEAEDHPRVAAGEAAVDRPGAHARAARSPDRDAVEVVDAQVAAAGAVRERLVLEGVGRREGERRAADRHGRGGLRTRGQREGEKQRGG
jgi:hypothetical protein